MNMRYWLPMAIWICFGVGSGRAAEALAKPDAPRWLSDWEEGKKAARASGKPLFVVFRCEH